MENKKESRPKRFPWILIAGAVVVLVLILIPRGSGAQEIDITQVIQMAEDGQLERIEVVGDSLNVTTITNEALSSRKESTVSIIDLLEERGVETGPAGVMISVKKESGGILSTVVTFLPIVFFGALILFMMRRSQGGMSQILGIGKSRARQFAQDQDRPTVTFGDVAGADEAKQELTEVVEFLNDPTKFTKLGAKIPKGVLLVGPPGTGKTLMSRAVAGEAGVPFFSTSGSEFVEMFVGVGASRVRDLFSRAKQTAPAVVFIDEIDAVGRSRGAGIGGGNDEREQTLNQILVEMDGFDERTNVIVIAATNRPDILDTALIRPGRFDRRVTLDLPDVRGREAILRVHAKGIPLAQDVDLETIAKETPGFSGADLANLVNEAAILAARTDKSEIGFQEFQEAVDRVIAGPARKSRIVSEDERRIVAFHEAGHALVASQLPDADPVHRVTIVSRGASGGHTRLLPDEERGLFSKRRLEAMMAVMMGGQAAEEVVFGDITTGASNDLQNATRVARKMVTEYGMSELGPQTFECCQGQVFLGRDLGQGQNISDAAAEKIDAEVGNFLMKARKTAESQIEASREKLTLLANRLLAQETLEARELEKILAGEGATQIA
ncbi:MAG: ATP-dependent zinc metalloprotease FtsH [Chloroflexi bacterium]|nr:ATP-dependent zinc metalloprotease FtsH [Chloroflexota bacterium]